MPDSICIVLPNTPSPSETFLRAQIERLSGTVSVVHIQDGRVLLDGEAVMSNQLLPRAVRLARRRFLRLEWDWELTWAYMRAIRRCRPDVILAQYGPTGVAVYRACQLLEIPLVVHFHGYDASMTQTLEQYREDYHRVLPSVDGVIAVSEPMRDRLATLGARPDNLHVNTYGVDCQQFSSSQPHSAPPRFLAVGRLVDKKAPHMTILAFSKVVRDCPEATLRMIGDGTLLGPCQDLVKGLQIEDRVEFLGVQPPEVVQQEMRAARAFVQHSIEAASGDCEGTPVAIIEAAASALPVISTKHAGIPDVVLHGETGFLVEERDVVGMARHMLEVARNAEHAAQLGQRARQHAVTNFDLNDSIARLEHILELAANRHRQSDRRQRSKM